MLLLMERVDPEVRREISPRRWEMYIFSGLFLALRTRAFRAAEELPEKAGTRQISYTQRRIPLGIRQHRPYRIITHLVEAVEAAEVLEVSLNTTSAAEDKPAVVAAAAVTAVAFMTKTTQMATVLSAAAEKAVSLQAVTVRLAQEPAASY